MGDGFGGGWVVLGGGCSVGALDVEAFVGEGEVAAGEGLDEGDVDGFVVGFEGGGGGAGFAVGEDEDGEGHFGGFEK